MAGTGNNQEFINLIKKYIQGEASEQEILFLEEYFNYFEKEPEVIAAFSDPEREIIEKEIQQAVWKKIKTSAAVIPLYNHRWFRVAAAAIVILLVTGAWLFFNHDPSKNLAGNGPAKQIIQDVPAPNVTNAVITLADGSKVILDNAQNGTLATEGNVKVLKLADGQIVYNGTANNSTEVSYNTITVPRGSKIVHLQLADGSEVWMNAASSLRYPTAFLGKERKVEISGEAYFEIMPNKSMPFIVQKGNIAVQVLGTHFNVNSYDDEPSVNVTLLEGSVKLSNNSRVQMLSPGQQAQINKAGEIRLNTNPDVDEVMAWKNGWFNFNSLQIENIMREISRWYDVEVNYEGKISDKHFSGIVSRDSYVSEVLKIMQQAGIKFKIEGKKITVLQ